MIKSMTGYGTATAQTETGRSYTVEIKSVNHRYCDVNVKLPGKLSFLDNDVKKMIKNRFQRGRFDVYIALDEFGRESKQITFDKELAAQYLAKLQELGTQLGLDCRLDVLSLTRLPEVLKVEQAELDQEESKHQIEGIVNDALERLDQMRIHEGQVLENDIVGYLEQIRAIVSVIAQQARTTPEQYKTALGERLKRLTDGVIEIDEARLAQEIVLFCDKIDISEEITRLNGHIDHFFHLLKEENEVGRKLDFLIQEMNREINTMGSKSNNVEIAKQVVEVKAILEKIREQLQNIE
jgi:uncharacterized protein (TIGR00255 family)